MGIEGGAVMQGVMGGRDGGKDGAVEMRNDGEQQWGSDGVCDGGSNGGIDREVMGAATGVAMGGQQDRVPPSRGPAPPARSGVTAAPAAPSGKCRVSARRPP